MQPGDLNRRIIVQHYIERKDQYNRPTIEEWVDYKRLWASIEPLTGREYVIAENTHNENIVRFRVWYSTVTSKIDEAMRVVYKKRIYDIESAIDEDDAHISILLVCRYSGQKIEDEDNE